MGTGENYTLRNSIIILFASYCEGKQTNAEEMVTARNVHGGKGEINTNL